jgi:hypothetical protein
VEAGLAAAGLANAAAQVMRSARELGAEADPAQELAALLVNLWIAQIEAEIADLLTQASLNDADLLRYRQLRGRADGLKG